MWQKSNETDFLFTEVFIFFKRQCYPFQNSSLGQLHTDGDVVPTFVSSAGSLQPVWSSAYPLYACFDLLDRIAKEEDFFSRVITGDESWIF